MPSANAVKPAPDGQRKFSFQTPRLRTVPASAMLNSNDYVAQLRVVDNSMILAAATGTSREFYRILGMDAVVDAIDMDGNTALHHLAARGRLDMAIHLLDFRKALINIKNKDGLTPLDLAAKTGRLKTVMMLAYRYPVSEASKVAFKTAARLATESHNQKVAEFLEGMAIGGINLRWKAPETARTVSEV